VNNDFKIQKSKWEKMTAQTTEFNLLQAITLSLKSYQIFPAFVVSRQTVSWLKIGI